MASMLHTGQRMDALQLWLSPELLMVSEHSCLKRLTISPNQYLYLIHLKLLIRSMLSGHVFYEENCILNKKTLLVFYFPQVQASHNKKSTSSHLSNL